MAKGIVGQEFQDCLKRGKIKKFAEAKILSAKELKAAMDDLKIAQESFKKGQTKWATVQAYYSMFHAARALIYARGYRERSHYCLIVAVKALFVSEGLLDITLVEALQMAKVLRENADYENDFSKDSAKALLNKAELWLNKAKEL